MRSTPRRCTSCSRSPAHSSGSASRTSRRSARSTANRRLLRLLRARGASRRKLLALAAIESALVGLVAGVVGAALALLTVNSVVGGHLTTWPWAVGVCVVVGVLGSFAGRVAAGIGALREEQRPQNPLWQRLYFDLLALAVSGLVWWLTARTGFSAVVSPDSNPTLSLSVYMFLAPALLWIGSTLLLVRIRGRVFELIAPKRATTPRDFLLVSAARRAASINRGLVIVALLLAFAVNLSVFSSTWDQQSLVDARLTVGSDIVVSGAAGVQPLVAQTPGITGTTALDHTYAYVGPDLQDVFAVDPATFQQWNLVARLVLPRWQRKADDEPPARAPRRDPRLEGDDHRLFAERRRPVEAADTRPPNGGPSTSSRSTSRASSRSSRPPPRTRSWSRTSRTSCGSRTTPVRTSSSRRRTATRRTSRKPWRGA